MSRLTYVRENTFNWPLYGDITGTQFPYPPNTIGWEVAFAFFYVIVEKIRLFLCTYFCFFGEYVVLYTRDWMYTQPLKAIKRNWRVLSCGVLDYQCPFSFYMSFIWSSRHTCKYPGLLLVFPGKRKKGEKGKKKASERIQT